MSSTTCVSIGRGRHRHMIAEHRHMVEQGARLVELRLDYINGDVNLKRLLTDRPSPVVIACRRPEDGGKWSGSEEQRRMLLRAAIAERVDYVDLEEDVAAAIPRFGPTKRIISLHNFRNTPLDLAEIHARLAALDADIVKLATMANSPHDNVRMLQLIRDSQVPTVGMCMGEMGTCSRILAGKFGAPFTYCTFHHERSLAPGQLSYRQMQDIYRYDSIGPQTEVYGVIADPIGHSLSPLIHNAAFERLGLDKVYVPFRVPREDLEQFLEDCPSLGLRGLSVTIPHKESIIPLLTKIDGAARGIGACNTVVLDGDQRLGFNTDYRAAMDSIDLMVGDAEQALAGQTALILGAGGVAKAVAFGLLRRGVRVVIAGRTHERAQVLARQLGCESTPWEKRHAHKPSVLVNGTPVGMHPNVDDSPFESRYLSAGMVVFDTVYNPEKTLLVKNAQESGCKVITGVDMFIRQAAQQFHLFTAQDPPADAMREALKKATGAAKG